MDGQSASTGKGKARKRPVTRALSASEYVNSVHIVRSSLRYQRRIARNVGNFETWSNHQRCEQASYESDVPSHLKSDVDDVFNVTGMLPKAWTDKVSAVQNHIPRIAYVCLYQTTEAFKLLELFALPEHMSFLEEAAKHNPDLFSDEVGHEAARALFSEIITVYAAWTRMRSMRSSKDKFSEADYAANV